MENELTCNSQKRRKIIVVEYQQSPYFNGAREEKCNKEWMLYHDYSRIMSKRDK